MDSLWRVGVGRRDKLRESLQGHLTRTPCACSACQSLQPGTLAEDERAAIDELVALV